MLWDSVCGEISVKAATPWYRKLVGPGSPHALTAAGARDALLELGYKADGLVAFVKPSSLPLPPHTHGCDSVELPLAGTWNYTFGEDEEVGKTLGSKGFP